MADTMTVPTLAELRARRDEILRIAAARGAFNVRVFGSVARGEATRKSDIDLLVEFEPGRNVLDLSGLILDLQDALDRQVDVVLESDLARLPPPSPFVDEVLDEAVPL